MIGFALVALVTLLVAGWLTCRARCRHSGCGATGRGPRDHGEGLVFDGTRYVNAPIAVGAPRAGQGYAVTALVFDGTTYRSAPVQVGGH